MKKSLICLMILLLVAFNTIYAWAETEKFPADQYREVFDEINRKYDAGLSYRKISEDVMSLEEYSKIITEIAIHQRGTIDELKKMESRRCSEEEMNKLNRSGLAKTRTNVMRTAYRVSGGWDCSHFRCYATYTIMPGNKFGSLLDTEYELVGFTTPYVYVPLIEDYNFYDAGTNMVIETVGEALYYVNANKIESLAGGITTFYSYTDNYEND